MEIGFATEVCIGSRFRAVCCSAIFAVACLLPGWVWGGDASLLLNGKAMHLDSQDGQSYNERNWGLGLQYDFSEPDRNWIPFISASEFRDSVGNVSWYAGGGILRRFGLPIKGSHLELGLIGFAMHREDYNRGRLFPGLLPVVSIGSGHVALNVTYVPKIDPKMVALVFFQLKIALF